MSILPIWWRAICGLALLMLPWIAAPDANSATPLRRAHTIDAGIVIDLDRSMAVVADVTGRAQAIALTDGGLQWRTTETAFPLALVEGRLLALSEPGQPGRAALLWLEPASGQILERLQFELPTPVYASVRPAPGRQFSIQATATDNALRLHWRWQGGRLSGAPATASDADAPLQPSLLSGAADLFVDADGIRIQPLAEAVPAPGRNELPPDQRVGAAPGRQFRSTDGQSILSSTAAPDARTSPFRFRWQFLDNDGESLGNLPAATSQAAFLLSGSQLYYRAPALGYRHAVQGWLEWPLRLVAVDLGSGTERWSVPILDPVYRGPMPP